MFSSPLKKSIFIRGKIYIKQLTVFFLLLFEVATLNYIRLIGSHITGETYFSCLFKIIQQNSLTLRLDLNGSIKISIIKSILRNKN